MKKSYDFSDSVKDPYVRKPKKQLTIRLDEEIRETIRAELKGEPEEDKAETEETEEAEEAEDA